MDPSYVVAIIMAGLGAVAFSRIKKWTDDWETRIVAQDSRLEEHEGRHLQSDIKLAVLAAELGHIKETTTETRKDVKKLLDVRRDRSTG